MAADIRFRRSRYARFVEDDEQLDTMETEFDALSREEKIDRNAWVDSVGDNDLKRDLGLTVEEDTPKRTRRARHPRPTARQGGDDDGNDKPE